MVGNDMEQVAWGLRQLMERELHGAEDLEIRNLQRVSEGYSRENWIFDGSWKLGEQRLELPLILRRDPVGSLLDTERKREFAILETLAASPLPVPEAFWLDENGELLGRPSMVMARAQGECDWFVLNSERPLENRVAVGQRLIELLAAIHQFDWRSTELGRVLADPGPRASLHELGYWEVQLRESQLEPHPELELVIAWLQDRAPTAQATVLVHGDFKPGNALLAGDEISAMLDWELAHLGDPLEDLGWATNPYRAREQQIGGAWEREEIVRHYEAHTGFRVRDDELRWWNVFSCFKLSVIILNGVSSFVKGEFDVIFQVPTELYQVMYELIDAAETAEAAAAVGGTDKEC